VIFHYLYLWKCFPKIIHAKALAEILKKDWDEKTLKQISDAIYKLEKCYQNEPSKNLVYETSLCEANPNFES